MERMTYREGGAAHVPVESLDRAIERLAAYEDMHEALSARLAEIEARIAARKAAGAMRGATGGQLLAQKVALKSVLGEFESRGIGGPQA